MSHQLTPHFTLEELSCHCPKCNRKDPGPEITTHLTRLAAQLEKFRAQVSKELGKDTPIHVHCAYRCPSFNASLDGAAKNSFHMKGDAADIDFAGLSEEKMFEMASGLKVTQIPSKPTKLFTGVGYYKGQGFVHVDIGKGSPRPNTWHK